MNEIEIYKSADGQTQLEVKFDTETVWLSQQQMALLFGQPKQNISLHVNNIFKEEELFANSVVKEPLTTAADGKNYSTKFYNLDVIISVGYRIKSARGTQFRIWATQKLKEYLVQGYAVNEKRLKEVQQNIQQLERTIKQIQNIDTSQLNLTEAKRLLDILGNYTQSFVLLNQFDSGDLKADGLNENITYEIEYTEAA